MLETILGDDANSGFLKEKARKPSEKRHGKFRTPAFNLKRGRWLNTTNLWYITQLFHLPIAVIVRNLEQTVPRVAKQTSSLHLMSCFARNKMSEMILESNTGVLLRIKENLHCVPFGPRAIH